MARFSKILAGCTVGCSLIGLSVWNIISPPYQRPSLPPGSYYARLVDAPTAYAECESFDDGTIIVEYASGDKTISKNGKLVSFTKDGVERRYFAPERVAECDENRPDIISAQDCLAIKANVRHQIAVNNCSEAGSEIR